MRKIILYILLISFVFIQSCATNNRYGEGYSTTTKTEIPAKYSAYPIPINFTFYYTDTLQTLLFFSVNPNDFLAVQNPLAQNELSIHGSVSIIIYHDKSKSKVLYEHKRSFTSVGSDFIQDSLKLKYPNQDSYYELTVIDVNRKVTDTKTGWLKKKSDPEMYRFLFYPKTENFPFVSPQINERELRVRSDFYARKPIYLNSFSGGQFTAIAPFSRRITSFIFEDTDTSRALFPVRPYRNISCLKGDFFVVSAQKESEKGKSVFFSTNERINENNLAKSFVLPMEYIMTREEFDALKDTTQTRKVFEMFWLKIADGDKVKAKKLIQAYFARVNYANESFASYKLGWQTDQGMIFIVFGRPDIVEKTEKNVTWIYGTKEQGVIFNFLKEAEDYIENNFVLQRNIYYKNYWYQAVENWAYGKYRCVLIFYTIHNAISFFEYFIGHIYK